MLTDSTISSDQTSFRSEDESSASNNIFEITTANSKDDFLVNPDGEYKTFLDYLDKKFQLKEQIEERYKKERRVLEERILNFKSMAQEKIKIKEKLITYKYKDNLQQYETSLHRQMKKKLNQEIEDTKEMLQDILSDIPQLRIDVTEKNKALKDAYNAYNFASKKYQKCLNVYIDVETVVPLLFNIYFFTSSSVNKDYSVTIQKEKEKWILIKIYPNISKQEFNELSKKLSEDGNFRYFLCTIRKIFIEMKNKENISV